MNAQEIIDLFYEVGFSGYDFGDGIQSEPSCFIPSELLKDLYKKYESSLYDKRMERNDAHTAWYKLHDEEVKARWHTLGIENIEVIEQEGGKGEGDHHHYVIKVTPINCEPILLKTDAYYSSYGGAGGAEDFCTPYECEAKKVTVIKYVKK